MRVRSTRRLSRLQWMSCPNRPAFSAIGGYLSDLWPDRGSSSTTCRIGRTSVTGSPHSGHPSIGVSTRRSICSGSRQ
jgi:hypothetical protein